MKLRYALLAERCHALKSGQLVIDGTADVAGVEGDPPYGMPSTYIVGAVVAEPPVAMEHELALVVSDCSGGELFRETLLPTMQLEAIGEGAMVRYIAWFACRLPPLVFPAVGVYEFQIYVDGEQIGMVPVYLARRKIPSSPEQVQTPGALGARSSAVKEEAISESLRKARETLRNAELALEDLRRENDARRQLASFSNVVVWGRAVTNVLQLLRSRATGFDEWYAPWRREMQADPLMKYMYSWRSVMLKRGAQPPFEGEVDLRKLLPSLRIPAPPPNATGFFIGDETGGVGWMIRLPDGTSGKIYMSLPEDVAGNTLLLTDLPAEHLGARIVESSMEHVATIYLHYLYRLLHSAEQQFIVPRFDATHHAEKTQ